MQTDIERLLITLRSRPETVLISQHLAGLIIDHVDGLKKRLELAEQEIAHGHATCAELRTMLTNAKAERTQFAREVDEANETIAELRAKLATAEADTLDREADLMLTAHKDPTAIMSRQTAGTLQIIGATMKARAALARAKAGQ